MYPWQSSTTSSAERWGIAYLFLALAFEILVRQVNDVATFVVEGIAILAAAFLGPFVVEIVSGLLRTEWSGLLLGLLIAVSCTLITVALVLTFRCFY